MKNISLKVEKDRHVCACHIVRHCCTCSTIRVVNNSVVVVVRLIGKSFRFAEIIENLYFEHFPVLFLLIYFVVVNF